MEHFVEPNVSWATIRDLLKDDGLLYVLVPDLFGHLDKDPYTQFEIPHTFYFSENTLARLLKNVGFIIVNRFSSNADEFALIVRKILKNKDEQKDKQRRRVEQIEGVKEFQMAKKYLKINGTLIIKKI